MSVFIVAWAGKPSAAKLGRFLVHAQFQGSVHSSALFLTAAAQNLLCLKLAGAHPCCPTAATMLARDCWVLKEAAASRRSLPLSPAGCQTPGSEASQGLSRPAATCKPLCIWSWPCSFRVQVHRQGSTFFFQEDPACHLQTRSLAKQGTSQDLQLGSRPTSTATRARWEAFARGPLKPIPLAADARLMVQGSWGWSSATPG